MIRQAVLNTIVIFTTVFLANPALSQSGNTGIKTLAFGSNTGTSNSSMSHSVSLFSVSNPYNGAVSLQSQFSPFESSYTGPVNVAYGDIDGDKLDEMVVAASFTGGPRVSVYLGRDLVRGIISEAYTWFAYEDTFRGGVSIAVADVTKDGLADVITGPGFGGAPRVRIFSGANLNVRNFSSFYDQFVFDSNFRGGINVAAADINRDGYAEVIVGAGPGGGPRVLILNGQSAVSNSTFGIFSQFVYEQSFTGGVFVAAGDMNGDGFAEVVTCAGDSGAPRARVFNGVSAASNGSQTLVDFFPFDSNLRTGCAPGVFDIDGDGKKDLLVAGPVVNGQLSRIRAYSGNLIGMGYPQAMFQISAPGGYPASISVAGGRFIISQCSNGVDDDGDGLIDAADPGCSNPNDDNESDGTTQCQDRIDNDGDGATDYPADFSCSSPLDNDERNPLSQCQNQIDDDGDGLVDLGDPGCSGKQDNSESDKTTQCQNGIDDDNDGFIDLNDPDCDSKQDDSEQGGAAIILPIVECVQNNKNGTYTAYFGYSSSLTASTTIPTGITSSGGKRAFNLIAPSQGVQVIGSQISAFAPGRNQGVMPVTFSGEKVQWIVRPANSGSAVATATRQSPLCKPVTPTFACQDPTSNNQTSGFFGYSNPNEFEIVQNVGATNRFSPAPENRSQPTRFRTGSVPTAFGVVFSGSSVSWILGDATATATTSSATCTAQGCQNQINVATISNLDRIAQELAVLSVQAANNVLKAAQASGVRAQVVQAQADVARSKQRADQFVVDAAKLTYQIPQVTQTCADASPVCRDIDNLQVIRSLRKLYADQFGAIKRFNARSNFRKNKFTIRNQAIVRQGKSLVESGNTNLDKTPTIATDCSNS